MAEPLRLIVFVEDHGHQEFVEPLIQRLADETGIAVQTEIATAVGGHGRAITQLKAYQQLVRSGAGGASRGCVLVVCIDANCLGTAKQRQNVLGQVQDDLWAAHAIGCPDPHVERWYMADPVSFRAVVGSEPPLEEGKCERGYYKRALADAIRRGGHTPTLGGIEFGRELVRAMDLYRAGRRCPSLGAFVEELRASLRRLAPSGGA